MSTAYTILFCIQCLQAPTGFSAFPPSFLFRSFGGGKACQSRVPGAHSYLFRESPVTLLIFELTDKLFSPVSDREWAPTLSPGNPLPF